MFAAGGALVYAGDAVVQKLFFGPDDKKDDKDKNPVVTPSTRPTPTGSPTPTPGATALPTPGATASPTAPGTTPPTTPPSNPPTTPPPVKPPHTAPAHVVVTADDPRRATLWAIARENADSLLTPEQIAAARASGRDAETAAALRQLFQVNPQRGFRPELMDGIASAARGDPDTVRPGWEIDVENPAVG
jgi:hypothetical protein